MYYSIRFIKHKGIQLKNLLFFLIIGIFFYGCVAPFDVKKTFSPQSLYITQNKGYVIFADFDIPQAVTRKFMVSNGIVTSSLVKIYDVTDEIKFIGYIGVSPPVLDLSKSFIESSIPFGKRIFMLVEEERFMGMTTNYRTDFIEIDVKKNTITKIALSLYPDKKTLLGDWTLRPKFTQISIDDKTFDICSNNAGDSDTKEQNIINFMRQEHIDPQQKYFKNFCKMLSSERKNILTLNEKSQEDFEKNKAKIEEVKKRDFPEWEKTMNKNRIFPLIQPQWVFSLEKK